jgi:hypothetical protein
MDVTEFAVGFNVFTVIVNVCLLAMTIKLYTEYFKDKSATNRREKNNNGK